MLLYVIPVIFLVAPVLCGTIVPNTPIPLLDKNDEPPEVQNHPNLRLLPQDCGFITANKVLNGPHVLLYELPWMVPLSYTTAKGNRLSCVGTLINERYVLTAAQCVSFIGNRNLNGAILGEYDLTTDPDCDRFETSPICGEKVMNVTIEEIIPHPGYSKQKFTDDIALIRLVQPVDIKSDAASPICLPITPELQRESLANLVEVVGWDLREDKAFLPVLLKSSVSIVSNEECQEAYNNGISSTQLPIITSKHICAKTLTHGGDPGGPLVLQGEINGSSYRHVQRGIVSFGPRIRGTVPEVYTRVAYYMKWILDNIHT